MSVHSGEQKRNSNGSVGFDATDGSSPPGYSELPQSGDESPVHPGYQPGNKYQSNDQLDDVTEEEPLAKEDAEEEEAADRKSDVEVTVADAAQQGRAAWDGKVEFFLTCVGYAVGLGNVWRFPYLCYKNGGGAFLLPYCIMLAVVGLPCFFLEVSFGQFASLGPLTIWRISPLFKGLGVSMVMVSLILSVYYNVIVAQCLMFLVSSFTSQLPWERCGHWWNSDNCHEFQQAAAANQSDGVNATEALIDTFLNCSFNGSVTGIPKCKTPSEEFYEEFILGLTDCITNYGSFNWRLAIALLVAWILVTLVLLKGIQSLGKVSYFTAIFPYCMLTILLVRGATLPGASRGVLFYITPKWERLADYRVWMEAATQIFFSLSCCNGGLIAMSSYNKFRNNCQRDAVLVALINCGTSVFAGFVIFCNLGFMSHQKGVPVEDVAKGGPGLAFVVYPEALTHMPLAPVWAVLFFVMMATLGFGSQFSITETVLCAFEDELRSAGVMGGSRRHAIVYRIVVCSFLFICGLSMTFGGGMYLLNLIDNAISTFPLLVCGLVELTVLMYIYGYKQFAEDIRLMVGGRPNLYWRLNWMVLTPLTMLSLIVLMAVFNDPLKYDDYVYTRPFQILCILIGVFVIMWIAVCGLFKYCKEGGALLLKEFLKPVEDWGPAKPKHRDQFLENIAKTTDDGGSFFQSKLSIAAELQRAASKESGLNRVRTHTNSFSALHYSASNSQFAVIDQQLIASAANIKAACTRECQEMHQQQHQQHQQEQQQEQQQQQQQEQQEQQQQQVPFSGFIIGADEKSHDDMQTVV